MSTESGTRYYLKSHRKYFINKYPPKRSKQEWLVQIGPTCQSARIQFHDYFGIVGDLNQGRC